MKHDDDLGAGFPSPVGRLALVMLLPTRHREELVGDLVEEAATVVLPRDGRRAARRWFWREALASASPLYVRQTEREVPINRWKWITIVALLVAGVLMALDPNVFSATPGVVALVVLAILVPVAAGLVSSNRHTLAGAAAVSALLLLIARLVSGLEIRWYGMAFMLFIVLSVGRYAERRWDEA